MQDPKTTLLCFVLGHIFVWCVVQVHSALLHVYIAFCRPTQAALRLANVFIYMSAMAWTGAYVLVARTIP